MTVHLPFLLQLYYYIFLNQFQVKGVRKIKLGKFEFKKKEKHEPDKIPVYRKKSEDEVRSNHCVNRNDFYFFFGNFSVD